MTPAERLKEIEELFRLNQEMFKRQGVKQIKSEVESFEWLIARVKRLEVALKKISANTYGTELCNTEEENNEIIVSIFFIHQRVARKALSEEE